MSPRLGGVSILSPEATGAQYRRWRRSLQTAFTAKRTWGHCDGTKPMPMPERVSIYNPVSKGNSEPQPSLLEERRAWVKKDRDVKMDLFLSVADDIKLEVFEVGPPLPPSAMTAKEMMDALDERFDIFKFEDYHHVFCHFLNLHIDQFNSLEEFNTEFLATLEDLTDHGFPLHNTQACSAYFSKLRCTQNPWVAKKLKEWDTLPRQPELVDLLKEVPPWIIIKPLAPVTFKPASQTGSESSAEEMSGSQGDSDDAATISSTSSQEITVHASVEDLTDAYKFPTPGVPKRISSKHIVSQIAQNSIVPINNNRPLPPIPATPMELSSPPSMPRPSSPSISPKTTGSSLQVPNTHTNPATRPSSPYASSTKDTSSVPKVSAHSRTQSRTQSRSQSRSHSRSSSAGRSARPTASPSPRPGTRPSTPINSKPLNSFNHLPPALPPPSTPLPSIPTTPELSSSPPKSPRPLAPTSAPTSHPTSTPLISQNANAPPQASTDTFTTYPPARTSLMRQDSSTSSCMSLPLQGVPETAMGDTGILVGAKGMMANRPSTSHAHSKTLSNGSSSNMPAGLGIGIGRGSWESDHASGGRSGPHSWRPGGGDSFVVAVGKDRESGDKDRWTNDFRKRSWSIKSMIAGRKLEVKEII